MICDWLLALVPGVFARLGLAFYGEHRMSIGQNPVMKPELFESAAGNGTWSNDLATKANVMTIGGTVNATFVLLLACIGSAVGSWMLIQSQAVPMIGLLLGGVALGFVLGLVMVFKPAASPFVAVPYAIAQGVFLGAVSMLYAERAVDTRFGGATGGMIVANAAICTFATLGAMLGLYKVGLIRATAKFKAVMLVLSGAVLLYSLAMIGMSLFGVTPQILIGGPLAIGIAVAITVYAALCLIMDFDFVEQGAANGAPKHMEWFAAFATLATLVFIYLQFLRLLALLNRRN